MATLEERVQFLETVVGIRWATTHPVEGDLVPENYLPDSRYPLMLSDYQIRLGIAKIEGRVDIVEKATTVSLETDGTTQVLILTTKE